jgi:CHAT domain-containing protein
MNRRFVLLLFNVLTLLWPVAIAQNNQDASAELDYLIKQKQFDLAAQLAEKMLNSNMKSRDWASFSGCFKKMASCFSSEKRYEELNDFVDKWLELLPDSVRQSHVVAAKILNWRALALNKQQDFVGSLDAYHQAIGIFEKLHTKGEDLAFCYKNAAQVYIRRGSFKLADEYLLAAISVDTSKRYLASNYGQLANSAYWKDSLELAFKYYQNARAFPDLNGSTEASLNEVGALILTQRGSLTEAKELAQKALEYYRSDAAKYAYQILRALTALADIATRQNQPARAERYYREAAAEAAAHFKNKSREVAKLFIETGLFYENRGQTQKALGLYQQALIQAFPDFNSPNIADNPAVAEAPLESQAMRAATAKARALLKTASDKAPASLRLNAAHCFDLAFAVATRLRHTYGHDADKMTQSTALRADYQSATLNLWSLWKTSTNQAYLERLFALIEQTKAQALADALQQQRALALAGIPDSLLNREASFRLEAAAFSKSLTEKLQEGDSAGIVTAKTRAFLSQKTYDDFLLKLEQQFPKFREYTDADLPTDFALVSKALPDTAALLSWFDAGDRYLWLWLHRGQLSAGEVLRDTALNQQLSGFIGLLADLNRQQADPAAFLNLARTLGKKLLPPDVAQVKSLVIVPDGLLSYLPFEVLLTAAPTQNSYAAAPYLLRSCAPVYVWSAKLLTTPPLARLGEGLAHFAPFAATSRNDLSLLPHSLADVPESVSADQWAGAAANSSAFLKQADQFRILHLSTHAQVGKSGEPGIEFFDRTLRQQEIYAQRLQADLVCLSACETGAGQFAGGEGVLSLARAFAYAGAQSLVASLWQVNDQTTATLFSGFYQNLDKGMSRSEALRKAKLAALDAPGATKAPFYWAAFTLNGADGAVNLPVRWLGLWGWMLGGVVLSMVLFWGWRGRRKVVEDKVN